MATLSLRVSVISGRSNSSMIRTMLFEPGCIVYDACRMIRERIPEANQGNASDYGLFLADEDPKNGVWLENGRSLEYYLLRNGDLLEYKNKHRVLRVRMMDESLKSIQVDDSHTIGTLMVTICSKIGITNHDEYSLVRELSDQEKERTTTIKREKTLARDQKKLDEMKKKLHTDDELNWLDHGKTLREYGVTEEETLLLRRKYFFSDQNVDARDPVQLNLLYVQSRDGILNGTHPVTMEEAVQFGGIQCQIQFGDHVENKHKPGYLELKEFLPKEYLKVKGVEKKIFAEHKKLVGVSEIEGKSKYTALCRSLKTYGITFFLVKEKMKGKNKLVPRLLGITKESVLRMDEKTKEIMKTWPLTTVKRWAASPNSFTLDFGDYSETYYSVQTTEGEQISALIAGYIDIILKKKKAKDHFGLEGDEESTMVEDSVSPAKATIIQHQSSKMGHAQSGHLAKPAILRTGEPGDPQFSTGAMQHAQYTGSFNQSHNAHMAPQGQSAQSHGLGQAQRALLGTINVGLEDIDQARNELDSTADVPDLGTDAASKKWKENCLDVSRQNINSQMSAMNAATAQLITLTAGSPDDTDFTAVGSAVKTITTNITELCKDMRMVAALTDDQKEGERLLMAAKRLADAFSDMLRLAQPDCTEPRQTLLTAASKIGESAGDLLREVQDMEDMDKSFQETLLGLAKAVANATAALVLKAKGVASQCEDQAQQNKVISSATQCALATSQLVACTKVVTPTVYNPACQAQLIEAAKIVAKSVGTVVETAQSTCDDEKVLNDLGSAASAVSRALDELLQHVKNGPLQTVQQETAVDTILTATDRLFSSMGDAPEMVKQARVLAHATSQLVTAIRGQAETHPDSDMQKRLLAAAKLLADATAKMVEAAKGCASNPNDSEQQRLLRERAEELRAATNTAAANAIRKKLVTQLESCCKHTASCCTQVMNAAQGTAKSNTNPATHHHLMTQCKLVADMIPALVGAIKGTMNDPDSVNAQMGLITRAQDMIAPCNKLVDSAQAACPTIDDQAAAMSLMTSHKQLAEAIAQLRTIIGRAQGACRSTDLDGILDEFQKLQDELEEHLRSLNDGTLHPLPGETAESSSAVVGTTSKSLGSSLAQLLTAATQGNEQYTSTAARNTAQALRTLVGGLRGVAACSTDPGVRRELLERAIELVDKSHSLVDEAGRVVEEPGNTEHSQKLAQIAREVSTSLNSCVNSLPGQRDVDNAIRQISQSTLKLQSRQFPHTTKTYQEVQMDLKNSAVNLNQSAFEISSHSRTPQQMSNSVYKFGNAYEGFIDDGMTLAGITKDKEIQQEVVSNLSSTSVVSNKLLLAAKSITADPSAPNARNLLSQAARAVTESINHLIDVCTTSAPGQKECDNALRQMQMMKSVLDNTTEPISDLSYFDSYDGVMARSKDLGDAMTGITSHAKKGDLEEFCVSVKKFADSVSGLTENSAQAAYLIGIADPNSEPGRAGLVDHSQFSKANQSIQMACQTLINPSSTQEEGRRAMVLSSATVIAKNTGAVVNTCRVASSKTHNPVAKRHFVQSAKDVANNTATLVKAIKELDKNFVPENREKCAQAARPLTQAMEELTVYASSPEFASIPAKISPEARKAQEPVVQSARSMVDGACLMIQAAKQLAVNPKDPPTYQLYSNHSKSVSDSIKRLVTSIKDRAPGQKECDDVIARINSAIRDLDQASLAALSQGLAPRDANNLQGYQEQMSSSAKRILQNVEAIRTAAKSEAENLGHWVTSVSGYIEPLARGSIGVASKTNNSKRQMLLLDQTKTVAESALQFMYAAKEGAGNPKATHSHAALDEGAEGLKEALKDLLDTLEEAASQAGLVSQLIDQITKSISKVDEAISPDDSVSFVDHQTSMVRLAKQIARTAQDMAMGPKPRASQWVGKSSHDQADLGHLASNISRDYSHLVTDTRGAVTATANPEVASRIRVTVQELGTACVNLVRDAGSMQTHPTDDYSRKELASHAKIVNDRVSYVLAALQAGSRGTQACINAASTVSGIIGDLDTTVMFATAGTLNADSTETFCDHRESILQTAKALVEDTKTLVAGAASNQEQLAQAAQNAVKTITCLSETVKRGAAALGSDQPQAQVLLINAVKDVTAALSDLITATKNASGKAVTDPAMNNLKSSAKVMVANVTSLLKTVKSVEDETARGQRALESSLDAISQELRAYNASEMPEIRATAEDLIRMTKPLTTATSLAVKAGLSGRQDDSVWVANAGRKAISDLLPVCKAAAHTAETKEIRIKTVRTGYECCSAYRDLLEQLNQTLQKNSPENRQKMAEASKRVATQVTELVRCAETIKGVDWVDPDDPTVIAENELLGAANSIEMAAKKLAALRPKPRAKEANEELNFEEQILEAARSIAAATSALVKSASAAQRELVLQGKVKASYNREETDDDSQWSSGLISAARFVATATHSLCEAANAMIQGQASEEKLISSAKQVASSTAQLLVACKVKADQDSAAMRRLQAAGNAVKRATDALVQAAQEAKNHQEESSVLTINKRMVGGMAQVIMAQEEILRKEKELDMARKKLVTIRQVQYSTSKTHNQSQDEANGSSAF